MTNSYACQSYSKLLAAVRTKSGRIYLVVGDLEQD